MSVYAELVDLINNRLPVQIPVFLDVDAYEGYPPTGAQLPYVVVRPLAGLSADVALAGVALDWDFQYSFYCCAESVAASYNLSLLVMNQLQGKRVGNTTLSMSMGYSGAPIEGHYESQVTAQLNQGGI